MRENTGLRKYSYLAHRPELIIFAWFRVTLFIGLFYRNLGYSVQVSG